MHKNIFLNMILRLCWQGKQRVVHRDSVVQVELAELSAELDLDILSRLGSLNRAFSHCSTQTPTSGLMQVILQSTFRPFEINLMQRDKQNKSY